jgi:hypothetical protein
MPILIFSSPGRDERLGVWTAFFLLYKLSQDGVVITGGLEKPLAL